MKGYTTRDVEQLLGISAPKIRRYTRAGFLKPARSARGQFLFNFQDLVVLRAAVALETQRIPARTILRALRKLRGQLPSGRSLTELKIIAENERIVVSDGAQSWNPLSGQLHIAFDVAELAARAEPIARKRTHALLEAAAADHTAHQWYEMAVDLEAVSPAQAQQAYARALQLDPRHTDAHVNLGRLLHQAGQITEAATHYLQALRFNDRHAIAAFNLGVAMEDLGRLSEALKAYQQSASWNPEFPEVHYNLAQVFEKIGNHAGAIRHYTRYRRLTPGNV